MKIFVILIGILFGNLNMALAHQYPNPISVQDANTLVEQGNAILIDIREKDEVVLGMASPAFWYAKSTIDADFEGFISYLGAQSKKEIILYCRSGRRVSLVIEMLAERGIHAFNMGGFQDWVSAGLPVKTPSTSPQKLTAW